MITMNRKLYEALRSIGIADTQAADVSEAITEDLQALARDLQDIRNDLTEFKAKTAADFRIMRWMLGVNLTLTVGMLWLLIRLSAT